MRDEPSKAVTGSRPPAFRADSTPPGEQAETVSSAGSATGSSSGSSDAVASEPAIGEPGAKQDLPLRGRRFAAARHGVQHDHAPGHGPEDQEHGPEAENDDTASDGFPFGRPGQPLRRTSPFYIGFVGGLGVLAAWAVSQALVNVKGVLILLTVSLFLAVGLNPFVERLERRGMARGWAVLIVALSLLAIISGFIAAISQPLAAQTTALIDNIPGWLGQLQKNPSIQKLDDKYDLVKKLQEAATNLGTAQSVAGGVLGIGRAVVGSVFQILTILILTLYFLASLPHITHHTYLLVPRSRRRRVQLLGDEILIRTGRYVSGQLLVATIAGVTAFIFLSIVGLDYALPMGLLVGFTSLIPMVGATIGAVVVTLVALFSSLVMGLVCFAFFLIYQQVENYLIYPRVMKRAVDVPPAMVIVAALIGGTVLGFVGALMAIPMAASFLLIMREVILPRQDAS